MLLPYCRLCYIFYICAQESYLLIKLVTIMLKNCSFSAHCYKVYGCNGPHCEEYIGTVENLSDALSLCRIHVVTYSVFSIYVSITDVFCSDVFLGCLGSDDLKF